MITCDNIITQGTNSRPIIFLVNLQNFYSRPSRSDYWANPPDISTRKAGVLGQVTSDNLSLGSRLGVGDKSFFSLDNVKNSSQSSKQSSTNAILQKECVKNAQNH